MTGLVLFIAGLALFGLGALSGALVIAWIDWHHHKDRLADIRRLNKRR